MYLYMFDRDGPVRDSNQGPLNLYPNYYTSTRLSLIKGWFLFNNRNKISYPALQEWNFQPLPFLLSGLGNHLVQVFQQLQLLLHKQTKLMKSQLHMRVISLTSKSVYTLSEKPFILKKNMLNWICVKLVNELCLQQMNSIFINLSHLSYLTSCCLSFYLEFHCLREALGALVTQVDQCHPLALGIQLHQVLPLIQAIRMNREIREGQTHL